MVTEEEHQNINEERRQRRSQLPEEEHHQLTDERRQRRT
jgi:hypothetical protein